ncbi:A-kinase anchor protein 6-like, partial [Diretmus argenteus]
SLCAEVRGRRRGVSSVLRLCQKLLQQSLVGPLAEVGPEAEQHREALQLLSINLERRWEAIVMQALQWQNRLRRELGDQQVPGNFLEPGLVDLRHSSPVSAGPGPPDDSWEWDETDMTITEPEPQDITEPDLTQNLPTEPNLPNGNQANRFPANRTGIPSNRVQGSDSSEVDSRDQNVTTQYDLPRLTSQAFPPNNNVYQVYSLHHVQLYNQPPFPIHQKSTSSLTLNTKAGKRKQQPLLKSLSKDSSFSSIESLPDLLGGLVLSSRGEGERNGGYRNGESEREGSRGGNESAGSRRSESESGIVSDTGETETVMNSEILGEGEEKVGGCHLALHGDHLTMYDQRPKMARRKREENREKGQRREENRGESRKRRDDKDGESRWTKNESRGESRRNKDEMTKKVEEKRRRQRRGGGEAVEILINGRVILTPADSDSDFEVGGRGLETSKPYISHSEITEFKGYHHPGLETPPLLSRQASPPSFSQGSSLESLLALGAELFPSGKDPLQRSASLESCLAPCRSTGGETGGSLASLGELGLGEGADMEGGEPETGKNNEAVSGEPSSGELSRRTLELLKRLESIQSPLAMKMTRSVSDMTLQSSSPQRSRLPASPSLGGRHAPLTGVSGSLRKGPPSLIESSATASLTELSSTEDSSLGSEDFAALKNHRHFFLDPATAANANSCSFKKRCHGNNRGGLDEADATSVSMVVNVSCTSACTDEDEDDSDLLSSSTLTLTEEELGVRDGEEDGEERLSGASSGNEEDDEEDDEEEMEGSYVLGLEYMKRELQSWIRPRTSSSFSSSKTEAGLWDELQCGTNLGSSSTSSSTFTSSSQNKEQRCFLNRSALKLLETHANNSNNKPRSEQENQEHEEEENRRNATRIYISQFVDDVENGNVDQSSLRGKDEDDELLREESSLFTKKGESFREAYAFAKTGEPSATTPLSSPPCELLPFPSKRASSLVGQLRGELPCHSSSLPSPPSLSPIEDCTSHDALHNGRPAVEGRKAITIQENFAFSSVVLEKSRREVRDKESSLPPKKRHSSHSSCCSRIPSSSSSVRPCGAAEEKKENVHDFVMEIIDMASLALKSKEKPKQKQAEEIHQAETSGSLAQIRDKVLEHSHQPLHLRKGDFYSYLSLSSHDSDCGEVSQCFEDKSTSPAPYSIPSYRDNIRDQETLFAACTEEVYLGPPLCYSMVLTKKPPRFSPKRNESLRSDRNEDSLYFEGTRPIAMTEATTSSLSPFLGPHHSSSLPLQHFYSLRGPGSEPHDVDPPSPRGAEEEKRGEDPRLLCDVARGEAAAAASVSAPREERSRNEGPPYLNPRARVAPIDSSAAECLADTKTLESNMGAVMTKISVCSSATNPSKEPVATATRINPKINRSAMREADREEEEEEEEEERRGGLVKQEKGREGREGRGRTGLLQQAKTTAAKQ